MAMEELKKEIEKVVQNELDRANAKFPMFKSQHEGYAVILEELEEAKEALREVELDLKIMWGMIRGQDLPIFYQKQDTRAKRHEDAIAAICEMVQVAAMFKKYAMSIPAGTEITKIPKGLEPSEILIIEKGSAKDE